jgi:tRNA 2-thiouridine synthesizing protein A
MEIVQTLDCRGKRCPLPIIEVAAAIKNIQIGQAIELISDDPASKPDLIAWARMTSHQVSEIGIDHYLVIRIV